MIIIMINDTSIQRLEDYKQKRGGRLITTPGNNTDNTKTNWTTITKNQKWEEKQLYGCFNRIMSNISHEKTWMWLRKGNLKKETESLLIATQNNAIRTNPNKAKIDKMQQNSKCRLCSEREETINHIIRECRKLAEKEYETRHDRVGKVIQWEMCKNFKFDYTDKWYTHNPA